MREGAKKRRLKKNNLENYLIFESGHFSAKMSLFLLTVPNGYIIIIDEKGMNENPNGGCYGNGKEPKA